MTLAQIRSKFNSRLKALNGITTVNFSTTVETAYEALVLAHVMNEYKRIYGALHHVNHPTHKRFLKQRPGKFSVDRSFRLDFISGESFYVTTDVEIFGLEALHLNSPVGIVFEADVVVIPANDEANIVTVFHGHPAPQHIHSAYECKFGSYNKGQLRELLGLKRHLTFLVGISRGKTSVPAGYTASSLFGSPVRHSSPPIPVKMARPRRHRFLDKSTADLFDLAQIVIF